MNFDFERKIPTPIIEKGDVLILKDGRIYLVIEGDDFNEVRVVSLITFSTSTSVSNVEEIPYICDIEKVIKSDNIIMGVR